MREIISIAFLNFKQGVREKLFWGVIFFFAFFLSLCVLLGKLSPGETEKVLRNAGLSGIELSGLVLVVFSLVLSFKKEEESRFLEIYLSNFSRTNYLSGKLIGYLLICLFYLLLSGLGYMLILFLYKSFIWQVAAGFYSLFLKLSILICFSLVFCCLFSSPIISLFCSLSLYLASEAAYPALKIVSLGPNRFRLSLFKFIYYLLPNMNELDIKSLAVYGELPSLSFFFSIGLYAFVYILFLWLIARFIFLKKEY